MMQSGCHPVSPKSALHALSRLVSFPATATVKPNEIYKEADPSLIQDMFMHFREEEREIYKSALSGLAGQRKLRPVFVQKKPVPEQIAWMHKTLQMRACGAIGEHLFQVYFMKGQQALLITFCDGLGIEHNGEGTVEGELPKELDADKLKETVDALLKDHDPKLVTLYLRVFNLQVPGGWPSLAELLESDERLKLA